VAPVSTLVCSRADEEKAQARVSTSDRAGASPWGRARSCL